MIQNAKYVIIAVDSTKAGTTALCFVCDIKTPDILITDTNITAADERILTEGGLNVVAV